jgi:hypothetical protein
MKKPHYSMRLFYFVTPYDCAHENHEQGIIVSSRVNLQRMRMMRVILTGKSHWSLPHEELSTMMSELLYDGPRYLNNY